MKMKRFWRRILAVVAIVGLISFSLTVYRQQQRIAGLREEHRRLTVQLEEAVYQARLQALVAEHAGSDLDKTRLARSRLGWVPGDVILFDAGQTGNQPLQSIQP